MFCFKIIYEEIYRLALLYKSIKNIFFKSISPCKDPKYFNRILLEFMIKLKYMFSRLEIIILIVLIFCTISYTLFIMEIPFWVSKIYYNIRNLQISSFLDISILIYLIFYSKEREGHNDFIKLVLAKLLLIHQKG